MGQHTGKQSARDLMERMIDEGIWWKKHFVKEEVPGWGTSTVNVTH